MKRPIPNTFQAVRELPGQSKISIEKYEQNFRAHMDSIKRNNNLNDIGLKVREMAQQKKNKTVNFQDIPTPIDYQEIKTPKSSKTCYDDYQFHQHIEEDDTTDTTSNQDDVDSVYEDNDQFDNDTQSEANSCCNELPQIRESIINLEKGRDYLYDMMSSTITNLKSHGKGNVPTSKKDSSAAGDNRTNQSYGALMRSDVVIKKIEAAKLDCYKKIENNLIRLKDIDDITTKLYQNYVDDVATGK